MVTTGLSGVRILARANDIFRFRNLQTDTAILLENAGSYFQGEKKPELAANHLSAPAVEATNKWNYNFTLPMRLHVAVYGLISKLFVWSNIGTTEV
jgi:hypothetical protein